MSLSWGKPVRGKTAPVTAYRIESWQKGSDGGARWTELGQTPINHYDIFNPKLNTQYYIRVTPRNRYGWGPSVQTTSPISSKAVEFLPEFTKNLPGQFKALVGQKLQLECIVKGSPTPDIVWCKDGTPIDLSTDRIGTKIYASTVCQLEFKGLQLNDTGRYSCEAVNSLGRTSTFARVQVVSDYRICEADNLLKSNLDEVNVHKNFISNKLSQFFHFPVFTQGRCSTIHNARERSTRSSFISHQIHLSSYWMAQTRDYLAQK